MSPEAYSAIFAGLGVLLTGLIFWINKRKNEATERANQLEEIQNEAEEHTNEKLGQVLTELNEIKEQIRPMAADISYLKTTVAVHEDRWERPSLRAVGGERRW